MIKRVLLLVAAMLAMGTVVQGQTVNNPTTAQFNPSPDHNTIFGGNMVVDEYLVTISGPATKTVSIGKPVPDSGGVITFTGLGAIYAGMPGCPVVGGTLTACYTASVAAKGPGGTSAFTPASNPFSLGTQPSPAPPRAPTGSVVVR